MIEMVGPVLSAPCNRFPFRCDIGMPFTSRPFNPLADLAVMLSRIARVIEGGFKIRKWSPWLTMLRDDTLPSACISP
jgi:hypothetical protein